MESVTVFTIARPRPCVTFRNIMRFCSKQLLYSRPDINLDDHSLSAVFYWLFNVFPATLLSGGLLFHPVPKDAPCSGDTEPLNIDRGMNNTQIVCVCVYTYK
jgi:hypothetical protein